VTIKQAEYIQARGYNPERWKVLKHTSEIIIIQNMRSKRIVPLLRFKSDQLCWHCKNACGGCAWSRHLEPVKGWKAKAVFHDSTCKEKTYHITDCPEFEAD